MRNDMDTLSRLLNIIKYELFIFPLHDRINYADQAANNLLASKVGSNSGSLWSNIATVNYPSGLAGPVGMLNRCLLLIIYHIYFSQYMFE